MLKKTIKEVIFRSSHANKLYTSWCLLVNRFLLSKKIRKSGLECLTRQDVLNLMKKKKPISDVCHIIGSGRSLNDSLHLVKNKDFVIGFNYAALADIDFDLYFFEFGGLKVQNTSENHLKIAKEIVSKKTDLIFFKNICEDKNDISWIRDNWADLSYPVKDTIYPLIYAKYANYIVEKCFNDSSEYIPQLCSSVMTSIFLAYQCGFKNIVVHGLDFGGLYFYEESIMDSRKKYLPKAEGELGNYSKSTVKTIHPTASAAVGMKEIIPVAHDYLLKKNVKLFSASLNSPSSDLLPVYKKEIS